MYFFGFFCNFSFFISLFPRITIKNPIAPIIDRTDSALTLVMSLCALFDMIFPYLLIIAVPSESIVTSDAEKLISFAAKNIGLLYFRYFMIFIIEIARSDTVNTASVTVIAVLCGRSRLSSVIKKVIALSAVFITSRSAPHILKRLSSDSISSPALFERE